MDTSSKPQLYENTRYNFERNARKTITVYLDGTTTTVSSVLYEPITIDALSDVYIDSFISNNGATTTADAAVFILGVDEFNIRSVSNDPRYNNKVIIPNTTNETAVPGKTIAHRATKFNYVGTINPCTLTKLTVSLTDNKITPGPVDSSNGHFWITFVIVAKE